MNAKTNTQHQRDFKKRKREEGFYRIELWAHDDDRAALKDIAATMAAHRKAGQTFRLIVESSRNGVTTTEDSMPH